MAYRWLLTLFWVPVVVGLVIAYLISISLDKYQYMRRNKTNSPQRTSPRLPGPDTSWAMPARRDSLAGHRPSIIAVAKQASRLNTMAKAMPRGMSRHMSNHRN